MPCYYPNLAFQHKTIKQKLRFVGRRNYRDETGANPYESDAYKYYSQNEKWKPVTLPCGKCLHCRLKNSQEKGIRAMHEAEMHKKNCFLTLTYDDQHLPMLGAYTDLTRKNPKTGKHPIITSFQESHVSEFLKRLRAHLDYHQPGTEILTFGCAEYGEKFSRPHYHIIIFGYDFEDKEFLRYSSNDWSPKKWPVYHSELLKEKWPHGKHEIGSVTYESACYVARYVTKKISGDMKYHHYNQGMIKPEKAICISKKGIGKKHLEKYADQILATDAVHYYKSGEIQKSSIPRYYAKLLEKLYPEQYKKMVEKRLAQIPEIDLDKTKQRMLDREKVHSLRVQKLKRTYEKLE